MSLMRDTRYRDELARLTPSVRQFARALVHDHGAEAADDLVQATLVRAIAAEQQRVGERLAIWLLSVLTELHRAQVCDVRADHRVSAGSRRTQGGAGRSQAWDLQRAAGWRASAMLGSMPLEDREALLLVVLARLTYAQVAETLGVSINTVLTRLGRARAHLGRGQDEEAAVRPEKAGPSAKPRSPVPHLRVVK